MYKIIVYKYNIILFYFVFRMELVQSLCLINSSGLFTGLLQVSQGICFIFCRQYCLYYRVDLLSL